MKLQVAAYLHQQLLYLCTTNCRSVVLWNVSNLITVLHVQRIQITNRFSGSPVQIVTKRVSKIWYITRSQEPNKLFTMSDQTPVCPLHIRLSNHGKEETCVKWNIYKVKYLRIVIFTRKYGLDYVGIHKKKSIDFKALEPYNFNFK